MNKWIAEFELEDGDTMPEHMDLNYMGTTIDFHCKPLEQEPKTKGSDEKVKSDERVNMRVPQEVKDEMMREAKRAGLNLTEYIIRCHEDNVLGKNEDIKKVRELLDSR